MTWNNLYESIKIAGWTDIIKDNPENRYFNTVLCFLLFILIDIPLSITYFDNKIFSSNELQYFVSFKIQFVTFLLNNKILTTEPKDSIKPVLYIDKGLITNIKTRAMLMTDDFFAS